MSIDYEEFKKLQASKRRNLMSKVGKTGKSSGGGQGGGSKYETPPWKLRREYFKPSIEQPTKIRIIPQSNGEIWYPFMSKWVSTAKGKRQIISNAWNGERDMPCVLYYYALEESKADFLASEQVATTVLVLEDFYKVPKVSAKGTEYHLFERSLGVDKHGRSLDHVSRQDQEKVFGRKLHWSMWPTQQRNLMTTLQGLTEKCAHCGEGEISVYAYQCTDCGEMIANHKEEPIARNSAQVLQNESVACPGCDTRMIAKQIYECVKQDGYKGNWVHGCDNPLKVSLNEPLDLVIRAVPAGKSTAIEVLSFAPADMQATESLPNFLTAPFEFDQFFGKMDLEEQATSMGVEMPFGAGDQQIIDDFFTASPNDEDEDSIPF